MHPLQGPAAAAPLPGDQSCLNEEKKGQDALIFSKPAGEQLLADASTKTCNLTPKENKETSQVSVPPTVKSPNNLRNRKQQWDATTLTSREEEEETKDAAGLKDEVKSEKQAALVILTFGAGAIITAKCAAMKSQAGPHGAGGATKVQAQGFFFWGSIGLWFTSILFSMLVVLWTTFEKSSRGLLMWSKIVNYVNICVTVVGVVFWILS